MRIEHWFIIHYRNNIETPLYSRIFQRWSNVITSRKERAAQGRGRNVRPSEGTPAPRAGTEGDVRPFVRGLGRQKLSTRTASGLNTPPRGRARFWTIPNPKTSSILLLPLPAAAIALALRFPLFLPFLVSPRLSSHSFPAIPSRSPWQRMSARLSMRRSAN